MEGAASYGLKEGIAVSFNGSAGSIVGFGYASPQARLNLSPCTRQLINAASFLVYSRLSEIGNQIPQTLHPLSDREREVLRWVALGKTKTEVAKKLVISQSTVKRHCEHIFAKLSTNSLAASVAEAIKRGELRSL
jgi:LuxR family quorum sensing-dependent transcriptional regulator